MNRLSCVVLICWIYNLIFVGLLNSLLRRTKGAIQDIACVSFSVQRSWLLGFRRESFRPTFTGSALTIRSNARQKEWSPS